MIRLASQITALCCIQFLFVSLSFGQIVFDRAPQSHMFLAQNKRLSGSVYKIKGKVTDLNYDKIYIDIYKDGVFLKSNHTKLKRVGNKLLFDFASLIPTAKSYYKLVFRIVGASTYSIAVDSVLVGDVYLIQGQSNAVAADYRKVPATYFDTSYNSNFIRSFGTSSLNWFLSQNDKGWYSAEASNIYTKGAVGQWAAVMAKNLLDSFDIPICLINGAVGGTPVNYHLPDTSNHFNVFTNYGRLLTRTENAGFRENISGIFYFQGESDGRLAEKHDTMFREIIEAWNLDYPGFGKLYVIQVRSGCGNPSIQLREVQRQFGLTIANCQTVSANGLNGHDGCHYNFKDGYESLGLQLSHLVGKDIYGSMRQFVNPPDINKAVYNNSSHTEIRLVMRRPSDSLFVDSSFYSLFRIVGDPSIQISGGKLVGNEIILSLNKASCLPLGLSYDGIAFAQTWVKSKTGMGMLSFYDVPVLNFDIDTSLYACKKQLLILGTDSIPGYSYKWTNLKSNNIYIQASPKIVLDSTTTFQVTVSHGPTICPQSDTITVKVRVDSVVIPKFKEEYVICEGKEIELTPNINGYTQFKWDTSVDWSYVLDSTAMTKWTATSSFECTYSDSFKSRLSVIDLSLPNDVFVCPGEDTLLTLRDSFLSYKWNGVFGSNTYRTGSGTIFLEVLNHDLCLDSLELTVSTIEKPFQPDWDFEICEGVELEILRPDSIVQWNLGSEQLPDLLRISSQSNLAITWVDKLGCKYLDSIKRLDLKLPEIDIRDTGFCKGDSVLVSLDSSFSYIWSDGKFGSSRYFSIDGFYYTDATDTNGCSRVIDIKVDAWEPPELGIFKDTLLCKDSSWLISIMDSNTYWINGIEALETTLFFPGNEYAIEAVSPRGCGSMKTILVDELSCINSVRSRAKESVLLYPNPTNGYIEILSKDKPVVMVTLFNNYGVEVFRKELKPRRNYVIELPDLSGFFTFQVNFDSGKYVTEKVLIRR